MEARIVGVEAPPTMAVERHYFTSARFELNRNNGKFIPGELGQPDNHTQRQATS